MSRCNFQIWQVVLAQPIRISWRQLIRQNNKQGPDEYNASQIHSRWQENKNNQESDRQEKAETSRQKNERALCFDSILRCEFSKEHQVQKTRQHTTKQANRSADGFAHQAKISRRQAIHRSK